MFCPLSSRFSVILFLYPFKFRLYIYFIPRPWKHETHHIQRESHFVDAGFPSIYISFHSDQKLTVYRLIFRRRGFWSYNISSRGSWKLPERDTISQTQTHRKILSRKHNFPCIGQDLVHPDSYCGCVISYDKEHKNNMNIQGKT